MINLSEYNSIVFSKQGLWEPQKTIIKKMDFYLVESFDIYRVIANLNY